MRWKEVITRNPVAVFLAGVLVMMMLDLVWITTTPPETLAKQRADEEQAERARDESHRNAVVAEIKYLRDKRTDPPYLLHEIGGGTAYRISHATVPCVGILSELFVPSQR